MDYKETIEDILRLEVNAVDEKSGCPETWPTLDDFREDCEVNILYNIGDYVNDEGLIVFTAMETGKSSRHHYGVALVVQESIVHVTMYNQKEVTTIDLREDEGSSRVEVLEAGIRRYLDGHGYSDDLAALLKDDA
jgi:hypothetical protein